MSEQPKKSAMKTLDLDLPLIISNFTIVAGVGFSVLGIWASHQTAESEPEIDITSLKQQCITSIAANIHSRHLREQFDRIKATQMELTENEGRYELGFTTPPHTQEDAEILPENITRCAEKKKEIIRREAKTPKLSLFVLSAFIVAVGCIGRHKAKQVKKEAQKQSLELS